MTFEIEFVKSYQVLNSRGCPSLETVIGIKGLSPVRVKSPQGASCGLFEPKDLLDGDKDHWNGLSVIQAQQRVKYFEKKLIGQHFCKPEQFDHFLLEEGLTPKTEVNVSLGLSLSFALSVLMAQEKNSLLSQFPRVMLNFINGGAHATGGLDLQEIMIVPTSRSPSQSLQLGQKVFTELKKSFIEKGYSTAVGDEGGFIWPNDQTFQALSHLQEVCTRLGYKKHQDYDFAIDCAANSYFNRQQQVYTIEGKALTRYHYQQWLSDLIKTFEIRYVEDPFDETDRHSYQEFSSMKDQHCVIIADDLTISQQQPIEKAASLGSVGGVIFKPNQNGLFSTFEQAIRWTQSSSLLTVFSHRSGDTEDHWLTDLALFFQADFLKAGALSRSERLAKYNQLLRREQEREYV